MARAAIDWAVPAGALAGRAPSRDRAAAEAQATLEEAGREMQEKESAALRAAQGPPIRDGRGPRRGSPIRARGAVRLVFVERR